MYKKKSLIPVAKRAAGAEPEEPNLGCPWCKPLLAKLAAGAEPNDYKRKKRAAVAYPEPVPTPYMYKKKSLIPLEKRAAGAEPIDPRKKRNAYDPHYVLPRPQYLEKRSAVAEPEEPSAYPYAYTAEPYDRKKRYVIHSDAPLPAKPAAGAEPNDYERRKRAAVTYPEPGPIHV